MTVMEVLDLVHQIEKKEVTIALEEPRPLTGNVTFVCSNGYKVVVFDDCGQWDYLDSVVEPDGHVTSFWAGIESEKKLNPYWEPVRQYVPPDDVAEGIYGLGGGLHGSP
jgi:hypothetical protein